MELDWLEDVEMVKGTDGVEVTDKYETWAGGEETLGELCETIGK